MIKMPYEEILAKLKTSTGLSDAELEMKIKAKCDQLSGLISKEGAAHIVANEYGIKLFEKINGKVTIKEILSGMRDLEVSGKVAAVYGVREFQRENGSGKVGNFMLADPTGTMRIVCWGTQADVLAKLQPGMIVTVKGGYSKENQGKPELHCNDRTTIVLNPEGVVVPVEISSVATAQRTVSRKTIKELAEGQDNVELLGAVVQLYDPRFWEACPQCNKRVKNNGGSFSCDAHGDVTPDYSYVMNCFLDDGTENIRVVFFKNQAQRLTGKTHPQFLACKDTPVEFESIKHELLGQMIKVVGKVQKNSMFDRLEFVAQTVYPNPNPEEEIAKIQQP